MSYQQPIGNPVDTWWNAVRNVMEPCIDLLAQFPPAPDSTSANELVPTVRMAFKQIDNSYYPPQAERAREYLLESLLYLAKSLQEQSVQGQLAPETAHNVAYHKFLMVTYFLLERGIYEPAPDSYRKQRAS